MNLSPLETKLAIEMLKVLPDGFVWSALDFAFQFSEIKGAIRAVLVVRTRT